VEVPLVSAESRESAVVGLLVSTNPVRTRLDRVVFADGLMTRPEGGGRLLLHSDAIDARVRHDTTTDPVPVEADELLDLARARLRHAETAWVESVRVGIRALPRDRKPVVGPVRDGLYVVVTHSGITLAPALGELVAGELLDGQPAGALAGFRPRRGPAAAS
jgi:glycine/D-amino acid oxidase-like deaminating enzyme